MEPLALRAIRDALEGQAPSVIATCAPDGTPNVSYISDVHFIDDRHIALSFQFFNRTRQNVLANPFARIKVVDPRSARLTLLLVQYLRTETEGPLFERMRARLAGIASQSGMTEVFRLRGADVYRVLQVEPIPGETLRLPPAMSRLPGLRAAVGAFDDPPDLDTLLDRLMRHLRDDLGLRHALLLLLDADTRRLTTVASIGYERSGLGAEVSVGQGVIGIAAQVGTPIRISHALVGQTYAQKVRAEAGETEPLPEIAFPGLPRPGSQLAAPVRIGGAVTGVLYVEHPEEGRIGYEDEDALVVLATLLGQALSLLHEREAAEAGAGGESGVEVPALSPTATGSASPVQVRLHARLHTVFVDGRYLIKGVAGALLWHMLRAWQDTGQTLFYSRELRCQRDLPLPEVTDNLAARLILLQRRLEEQPSGIGLQKAGRGMVRLVVERPLRLTGPDDAPAG